MRRFSKTELYYMTRNCSGLFLAAECKHKKHRKDDVQLYARRKHEHKGKSHQEDSLDHMINL